MVCLTKCDVNNIAYNSAYNLLITDLNEINLIQFEHEEPKLSAV